jgi:acid phosphatase class B
MIRFIEYFENFNMKFNIPKEYKNMVIAMRKCGYVPHEESFVRGSRYPRFHIYAKTLTDGIQLNLHLDQKKPSYKGSRAHNGEYDGPLVEQEAARIQKILAE